MRIVRVERACSNPPRNLKATVEQGYVNRLFVAIVVYRDSMLLDDPGCPTHSKPQQPIHHRANVRVFAPLPSHSGSLPPSFVLALQSCAMVCAQEERSRLRQDTSHPRSCRTLAGFTQPTSPASGWHVSLPRECVKGEGGPGAMASGGLWDGG